MFFAIPTQFTSTGLKTITLFNNFKAGPSGALSLTGIQAGDLCIFEDRRGQNSGAAPVGFAMPTGFTEITRHQTPTGPLEVYAYKLLDGSETSLPYQDSSNLQNSYRAATVFRGNVPIKSVTLGGLNQEHTNNNPTAQVITASAVEAPVIAISHYANQNLNLISPRTMTPAKDGEYMQPDVGILGGGGSGFWIAWKFYNKGTTPADVTTDMDDEGNANILVSYYMKCS